MTTMLRQQAELDALKNSDAQPKPDKWQLSPQAVVTYILGGKAEDGTEFPRTCKCVTVKIVF